MFQQNLCVLFHIQVKFKGRIFNKMYMPLKPTKFGVKIGPDVMTMVTYNNLKYTLGAKKPKFPQMVFTLIL